MKNEILRTTGASVNIYAVDAQFSTPNFSTTFGQQVDAVWFKAEVLVGLERSGELARWLVMDLDGKND